MTCKLLISAQNIVWRQDGGSGWEQTQSSQEKKKKQQQQKRMKTTGAHRQRAKERLTLSG